MSACLLGERVRYDGGHKRDRYLTDVLGRHVEWVPVCPEAELGLGTPRPSIRLSGDAAAPRLLDPRSGADHTDAMRAFAARRVTALADEGLHGFVLKKDSPSCGLHRVRVHPPGGGPPRRDGRGLFAARLAERFPALPVEEEGRLRDARLRERFVEHVFARLRWTRFLAAAPSLRDLRRFHAEQKYALLAHSPKRARELGRLVAAAAARSLGDALAAYETGMAACLRVPATRGRHANALQHLAGFVKEHLEPADRAELADAIDDHRRGLVPLIVPITLLRHHLRRHPVNPWAARQTYLDPYPRELMLRNHV